MTTPLVRRPLTDPELGAIFADIDAVTTTEGILARTIRALYTALLDGVERPDVGFGPGQHLDPNAFAIPSIQWRAIVAAATNRAEEWGGAGELGLDLINYLPTTYDDPTVAAPALTLPDRRPLVHQLDVTREAVDVIAANTRYLDALATAYGEDSPIVRAAATSWYRHLRDLLVINAGGHARVRADGQRSLHVTTASGFTFGIVFHPEPASTTTPTTDPTAPSASPATVDGYGDRPSPPLDPPEPGVWVAHS